MAGSMQPIVATDNGFMFRRFGPNDWRLVNVADVFGDGSHYFEDLICYGMYSGPNAPHWVYAEWYGLPAWSNDGGKTWHNTPDDDPMYGFSTLEPEPGSQGGDYPFHWSDYMIDGLASGVDNDGYVWGFSKLASERSDTSKPVYAHKSIDRTGRGHTAVFSPAPIDQAWVADGYIWDFTGPPSLTCSFTIGMNDEFETCMTGLFNSPNPTPGMLRRFNMDGGGRAEWPIHVPHSYGHTGWGINGWYGSSKLAIWNVFNDTQGPPWFRIEQPWGYQTLGTGRVFGPCIIDMSNPDAPTYHWLPDEPFGANRLIQNMQPVDNDVILALTWNGALDEETSPPAGEIWRSADGGLTWAKVAGPHPGLDSAAVIEFTGYDNEVCSIVVNHANKDEIWVATAVPYVWHSLDRGLTWTYEIVDTSPTQGYNGEGPYEWTAIAMGADPVMIAPGVAKYERPGTARAWFTRTNFADA